MIYGRKSDEVLGNLAERLTSGAEGPAYAEALSALRHAFDTGWYAAYESLVAPEKDRG